MAAALPCNEFFISELGVIVLTIVLLVKSIIKIAVKFILKETI